MTNNKKIIIFSAPSGSGKSTIVNYLLNKYKNLEFSISATSRPPLGKEKHGKEYYFMSKDEFEKHIENNSFIEYEEVYSGSYYGTLHSEIDRISSKGNIIIFDIDVLGGMNLKKIFGNLALSVFIKPVSLTILEQRLRQRGTDTEEAIQKRLAKAKEEMEYESHFDYVLVNDVLDVSLSEADNLIDKYI